MPDFDPNAGAEFERAVVVISLDAEQIWGYLDVLDEWRFCRLTGDALRSLAGSSPLSDSRLDREREDANRANDAKKGGSEH